MADIFDTLEMPTATAKRDIFEDISAPEKKTAADIPKIPGEEFLQQLPIGGVHGAATALPTAGEAMQRLADLVPQGEKSPMIRRMITNLLFPQLKGPTIEDTQALEKMLFGESLQPTTGAGRIGRHAGEFSGTALAGGEAGLIPGAAGALGESIREAGLPDWLASIVELVAGPTGEFGKKLTKPTTQGAMRDVLSKAKKELYDRFKSIGLSDQEITPLLQGEKKVGRLGPIAKKTETAKKAIFETSQKGISELYNPIKKEAASLGTMSQEQMAKLQGNLKHELQNLQKTMKGSPEKEAAVAYLEDLIGKTEGTIIGQKGEPISYRLQSPESLIDTIIDINRGPHWDQLKPVKDVIKKSLHEVDPKLAKKYDLTNEAFAKIKNLQKQIGLDGYEKLLTFGETGSFLLGLGTGNIPLMAGAVATEAGRQVATKLLTDPRWQGITRNIVKAAKTGNKTIAQTAYKQFKEKVEKDFPEEYEIIDWPD